MNIRDLQPQDVDIILALNNSQAKETSLLDAKSFADLLDMAFYARGIDKGGAALLIAFDQNAAHKSPNFVWFKDRRQTFIYVDRIIVSSTARGRGLARKLYEDLFERARLHSHDRVVCEVNIDPPNSGSEAFHHAMGFTPIGEARLLGGTKAVRYFEKILQRGAYDLSVRSSALHNH